MHLGDVCAHLDKDEWSEKLYVSARDTCVAARELCAEVVSDELLATMEDLVRGAGDEESDGE